jgi:hypothetical protein
MSPRRNRPPRPGRAARARQREARPDRQDALDLDRARRGVEAVEVWRGGPWRVRHIPGGAATKMYRCPGCDHEIQPGTPHVVVWPEEGGPGDVAQRRHWHTGCWRSRRR